MIKVTLLGDSITEYMPYIIDKNIKRGFNAPMISSKLPIDDITFYICGMSNIGVGYFHQCLWKDVQKDDIDYFVLLIGVNNLLRPDCDYDHKESLEDTFLKITLLIQDIIKSGKNLIVELLYPTDRIAVNVSIRKLNDKLRMYCEENGIDYLDLYNELLGDNGIISFHYTDDGLHPNENGYMLIIDKIASKIREKDLSKKLKK